MNASLFNRADRPIDRALAWGAARGYLGFDPYDALLSRSLNLASERISRHLGIVATQIIKRAPMNVRTLLGIKPGVNPKGLSLFLSAWARIGRRDQTTALAEILLALRSSGPVTAWGYNFPWAARAFSLPAWTPTVVVTSFVGEAFLDAHALTADSAHLEAALGACQFVLQDLNCTEDETGACLSYSPLDHTAVYNASVLGARLLTLTGKRANKPDLVEHARPLISYVLARQRQDGSWAYGEARYQHWIDSFHTGFILCALDVFRRATGDQASTEAVLRGARFFDDNFFGPGGEPYYCPNKRYPLDIHSAAQGILTFLQLRDIEPHFEERARLAARWMMDNMFDSGGYFYYQVRRTHTVKIPYMRWSQAWGARALAELVHCGVEL